MDKFLECPKCGSTKIFTRTHPYEIKEVEEFGKIRQKNVKVPQHVCNNCLHKFD